MAHEIEFAAPDITDSDPYPPKCGHSVDGTREKCPETITTAYVVQVLVCVNGGHRTVPAILTTCDRHRAGGGGTL